MPSTVSVQISTTSSLRRPVLSASGSLKCTGANSWAADSADADVFSHFRPFPRRVTLDHDDVEAIAGRIADHQQYGRRALLATLCLAGPRISELTGAPRARLDLHGGRLQIGEAKTEAGLPDIELTFQLQAELREHLAHMTSLGRPTAAASPIFPTYRGGRHNASNVRNRLLAECVRRANLKREADGKLLLPEKVTPHTLAPNLRDARARRGTRPALGHGATR